MMRNYKSSNIVRCFTFRNLLLICLILLANQSFASTEERAKITVKIINPSAFKFAYLVDTSAKTFERSTMVDGKTQFDIKKSKELQNMLLLLSTDSISEFKEIVLATSKYSNITRSIIVEDVEFIVYSDLETAKIVGGTFNMQFALVKAAKNLDDYYAFLQDHPNSPISISVIMVLKIFSTKFEQYKSFNAKSSFYALSEEVRKSPDGLKLEKEL